MLVITQFHSKTHGPYSINCGCVYNIKIDPVQHAKCVTYKSTKLNPLKLLTSTWFNKHCPTSRIHLDGIIWKLCFGAKLHST
jgi:hypothetical protein